MSDHDDRDRELADLKAQVERLSAAKNAAPPKVEVTGGPSSGGGFKGGFFGCFGVVAAIFTLIVVLAAMGQCSKTVVAPSAENTSTATTAAGDTSSTVAAGANWTYSDESDALHDKGTKKACTTSSNQVVLDFPYHNTDAQLCIRSGPRFGTDVYVELNADGQILCGIESCTLSVRFDKGGIQRFPAVGAADNSTNIIFLHRTSSLIAGLKKSSRTVVELTLFQAGVQTLVFNTAGLNWPPK